AGRSTAIMRCPAASKREFNVEKSLIPPSHPCTSKPRGPCPNGLPPPCQVLRQPGTDGRREQAPGTSVWAFRCEESLRHAHGSSLVFRSAGTGQFPFGKRDLGACPRG